MEALIRGGWMDALCRGGWRDALRNFSCWML